MISVGVAQIRNTVSLERNFETVRAFLRRFAFEKVDLALFPECGLSGFSANARECSRQHLTACVRELETWSRETGITIALPSALREGDRCFNAGFWISPSGTETFFKIGLTAAERTFFVAPEQSQKIFQAAGLRFGVLICCEIQEPPFTSLAEADVILWPGYWGWTPEDSWGAMDDNGKPNRVFANIEVWKRPVIQANFAGNDFKGESGPQGLSVVIDADNRLVHRARHSVESGFIVSLEKGADGVRVAGCRDLV